MLSLISTAPLFSEKSVPRTVKVSLAGLMAIAIAPTLGPLPQVPLVSAAGLWIVVQQILIGAAMGFSMKLVFAMVQAAGEYIGLQIATLAESFQILPIADAPLAAAGWYLLAVAGGQVFLGGLILALPLIATLLTLNLAMGILNRVSPQFSIFAVGFPITLLAGIAMLQLLMQYLAPFMEHRFAAGFTTMLQIIQGFRL